VAIDLADPRVVFTGHPELRAAMECPACRAQNDDTSRHCRRCDAPLGTEGTAPESPTEAQARPFKVTAKDSLVAGKYRIVDKIGSGGMGVVYEAEDVTLKRTVALKFLPPHLATSLERAERFLIEARAAAALSHPNICVIHEVGEAGGQPYIAMEHVAGETLRDRIKAKALSTKDVLAITSQVAVGLGEAHRRGIVHRDIKSANIMITGEGQAKIMDFGLAKVEATDQAGPGQVEGSEAPTRTAEEHLTRPGTTVGTVAYMSPEQARGERVDGRTDLWSLGVVLYEMLTGELPFKGDRDVSILHSIIYEDPRPFTARTPPVPAELQRVVGRALQKRREARYGSAEEMLAELRAYERALQAEASGVLNLRSLARRLRRPAVAVPVVLAVVAITAGAVAFVQHQARVRWAREVALPEVERMIEANDVWRNLVQPYRLAQKAEAIIPRDAKLAELFSKCSLKIDIRTEPPGARVSMKEYGDATGEWSYLGVTPLEKIRVPVGIFRWRLEKEGYEDVLAAASTWDVGLVAGATTIISYDLVRTLDKEGSAPPGMVRVRGAKTDVGTLADFFIGRYEVTNREYKAFVDAGGYRKRELWKHPFLEDGRELTWNEAMAAFVDPTGQSGPSTWVAGSYPDGQADYPVSGVSWYEAAAYAGYAGASLPTSAHWNVARGAFTPMLLWPQLGGFAVLAPFSNFSGRGPLPVGRLQGITPYGAFDMAGNVREWCWNETPKGRLIRGGAWDDNTYEFENRRQAPPMDRSAKNGFRLAVYPDPEAVPEAAFDRVRFGEPRDLYKETPVDEQIFQIYKEQYSYDRTELNARVESREESPGGWLHEKVSFDAAYGGERILAHLFLPRSAQPPFQTVIYFPGSASVWERSSQDIESYYEFTIFLSFLVKSGRAVLYPVYKGTFERGDPALSAIHGGAESHLASEYTIQLVKDFRRCVDYLQARPDVDGGRLAYYGMSWGGDLGAIIPAVEKRIEASVLIAGGLRRHGRPEVYPLNYVTRITVPTLMLNGRYDNQFETEIKPLYDLLGTPARDKRLRVYDTDHIPPRNEFIKETLAWLDKYLGPVKR
jgi:serine/threonine protein kinase/dienelactone hydrolase